MIKIPEKLLRGKNPEQVKRITEEYKAAANILRDIAVVLEKELVKAIVDAEHPDLYDANWPLRQADGMGLRRGLRKALKLLPTDSIIEEEDEDG